MHHVLVPVDTDPEQALTQAAFVRDLPRSEEAVEATVAHARPPQADDEPVAEVGSVERALAVLADADVEVDVVGIDRPPGEGIVALAEERDVDHVVMASRKQSAVEDLLFGSVTTHVVRHTEIPVTVTGPDAEPE